MPPYEPVKARDLKPGMVIERWDLTPGPGSTIKTVEIIDRPGYKYRTVKITMVDGTRIQPNPTEVLEFYVYPEKYFPR